MQEPTDRQLIIDMQHGDRAAMEQFYRRYSPYLFAVCLRYVTDGDLAKDLLHDSFIKILTSVGTFTINPRQNDDGVKRSVKSWSARITANLALNYLRDQVAQACSLHESNIYDIPDSDIDAESLSIDEITSLIFAGAGLQLNLNEHIALYAEPLATYYFDNHSGITNIYKDRPINIDLRIGLRYTFK